MFKGLSAQRRPNARLAKKTLRLESLEARQMLSVTTVAFDEIAVGADDVAEVSNAVVDGARTIDLSGYAKFDSFVLDAVKLETSEDADAAGAIATLSGVKADGTLETLQSVNFDTVNGEAVALNIIGRAGVAETLTITGGAATTFDEIFFNGGDVRRDTLVVQGLQDEENVFEIASETEKVATPIYANNPYEKLLERYADVYGENSPIVKRLTAVYEAAYAQLQQQVVVKSTTVGVVELNDGAQVKFSGVNDVALVGGDQSDWFVVESLDYAYTFVSGEGMNAIDFSEADGALNINMGSTARQAAILGDAGTVRLAGDFWHVNGTQFNDRFVGDANGSSFVSDGGRDAVTLVGGEQNWVSLAGPGQAVVVRNASAVVELEDGDNSAVNVAGSDKNTVEVWGNGDRVSVVAAGANVAVDLEGDFVSVLAGTAASADVWVTGSNANIVTGAGEDGVGVVGNRATINTGAGDDQIALVGAFSNVFAGVGDDIVTVADNDTGLVGSNTVMADAGDDLIIAVNASGLNRFNAGLGNDVVLGGSGTDYIYGVAGNNVLAGFDGTDYIYGGVGRDVLAGSQTSNLLAKLNEVGAVGLYGEIYENWVEDGDIDETVKILGEASVADGDRDWIYRGAGVGNLVYGNRRDGDVTNALEIFPFNDDLRLN